MSSNEVPDRPRSPDTAGVSRRRLLRTALGSAGAALALPLFGSGEAEALGKVSKAKANYQKHPHDGHHCSGCTYFKPPHSCTLVKGHIYPNGWCKFWKKG